MKHVCAALLLPLVFSAQGQTDNCEPIRLQIESRYRAGGVPNPALVVVAAGSAKAGRVVGSCGNGSRQIVFNGSGAAPTAPTAPASERAGERPAERAVDKIPTECKDGSIVIGPNCDDPRAVRMTSAEIAGSTAASATTAASAAATPAATPASKPSAP